MLTRFVADAGKVRMARNVTTQQFAAIKRVPKPAKGSKFSNVLEREVTVMKIVEHERIVKLIDVFETPKHLFVSSFIEGVFSGT